MMTFGSLFSGIGGFDLGFERAGMKCKWQCEIDPYCWQVLHNRWPDVPKWDDVRTFPPDFSNFWNVDVLCGGFPCQDISDAGSKSGIDGERSGLWREYARIIRVLRPRYAVVENVAAVLDRGHERILGDMATCGFDGEWEVLPACAFGAPHSRERMFYIFYPHGSQLRTSGPAEDKAQPTVLHFSRACQPRPMESWWSTQPEPCSVVYGVPGIVDELRPYGNAVCPEVAEWIGRRIVDKALHSPRS